MANNLQVVKQMLATDSLKNRFKDILGEKAPQFMASITNAVSANAKLQECDANSVMAAALVAATYDLPIDGNLGFAAIVPYGTRAQFQLQYKGFVQLAVRSGYYERMNVSEVYEDELVSYNPITGVPIFAEDFSKCSQREEGKVEKIVGFYAWFRLKTGFTKELYMTVSEVENHAKKYSTSYGNDLKYGKKSSIWSTNFTAMGKKTVLKQLLSKWGILSVEMQRAVVDDQKVYEPDGEGLYADNGQDKDKDKVIDVFEVRDVKEVNKSSNKKDGKDSLTAEEEEALRQDLANATDLPFDN